MTITKNSWLLLLGLALITAACTGSYKYTPLPSTFQEGDLIGTWQAKYGTPTTIDTITLRPNGTYQQRFESHASEYFYESPWNKWYIEETNSGKFRLYLEGLRYYAYTLSIGEAGGRDPDGKPVHFYDIDEDEYIEMTDKVILRIKGNKDAPRGIALWHMHIDLDASPPNFVLIDD